MMEKVFPDGMIPLGESKFTFNCHSGIRCFTLCCRNVDLILYPYDLVRLKKALKIDSNDLLRRYVTLNQGENVYFPTVKLKLNEDETKSCPFLKENGCSVYVDRPTSCRTYPLERAVDRTRKKSAPEDFYFLAKHHYCQGHYEKNAISVKEWIRNQRIFEFNLMNDLWAELDTLFASNPWKGEGIGGDKQRLAFMVCYNIDEFRRFVVFNKILEQFRMEKDRRRRLAVDDGELLKFGFEWLRLILSNSSSLIKK